MDINTILQRLGPDRSGRDYRVTLQPCWVQWVRLDSCERDSGGFQWLPVPGYRLYCAWNDDGTFLSFRWARTLRHAKLDFAHTYPDFEWM